MLLITKVQARQKIDTPDKRYEREADRMAEQVTRLPATGVQRHAEEANRERCRDEPLVSSMDAPLIVREVLQSPGQPLDSTTGRLMTQRFGIDFGKVRLHTDAKAANSATAVEAHAFTVGRDIVFGKGMYAPTTDIGRKLLAHELTHVLQQNSRQGILQRKAIHDGDILYEGTCEHLACKSSWACCDPASSIHCEGKDSSKTSKTCKDERWTPLFTCDKTCDQAIKNGCDDSAHWMAIPHEDFTYGDCDRDLVICANNDWTHAKVRDRSEGAYWEVSTGIADALKAPHNTFQGVIYKDESDLDFRQDPRCGYIPVPWYVREPLV